MGVYRILAGSEHPQRNISKAVRSKKKLEEISKGRTQQRLCLESEERVVFLVSGFVLIVNPMKPTPYFTINKVVPCPPTLVVQRKYI